MVEERVITVVSNFEKVEASKVTKTAKFKEDLDLDSLDAVEVVMAVEEEFGIEIPDSEADKIWSVADAVAYVSGHPMAK
jgi:NADH dehydrogenase (ubiquinone) 1 alpha/beta subcomplex 1